MRRRKRSVLAAKESARRDIAAADRKAAKAKTSHSQGRRDDETGAAAWIDWARRKAEAAAEARAATRPSGLAGLADQSGQPAPLEGVVLDPAAARKAARDAAFRASPDAALLRVLSTGRRRRGDEHSSGLAVPRKPPPGSHYASASRADAGNTKRREE
jgi:hypothetical protein